MSSDAPFGPPVGTPDPITDYLERQRFAGGRATASEETYNRDFVDGTGQPYVEQAKKTVIVQYGPIAGPLPTGRVQIVTPKGYRPRRRPRLLGGKAA